MCMEDVRIGRVAIAEPHDVVLLDGVAQMIVPPNDHRFALFLPCVQNTTILLRFRSGTFDTTNNTGFVYFGPLVLNVKDHGGLVTGEWWALSNDADVNYHWTESLLYEQYYPDKLKL